MDMKAGARLRVAGRIAVAAVCLFLFYRVTAAAVAFAGARSTAEHARVGTARHTRLASHRAVLGGAAALASADRAVVFVYAADCTPCNRNMWNWIDLLRSPNATAQFYAIATPKGKDPSYWSRFGQQVKVVDADSAVLDGVLSVPVTPTTLLIEKGVVTAEYRGGLSAAGKAEIAGFLHGTGDTR
ncbi:MAG TPA: hypothetical protein VFH27_10165 [Longimicrobiaceae bacterium]|nr:hypothetical protein [Longimicrobiaceae bacterium]